MHQGSSSPQAGLVLQDGGLLILEAVRQAVGVDDVVKDGEPHPASGLRVHHVRLLWDRVVLLGSRPEPALEEELVAQGWREEAEGAIPSETAHGELNCISWVHHLS